MADFTQDAFSIPISSWLSELFATEDRACARSLRWLCKCCRCARTECARTFHFSFRKRSGKSELFSIYDQNTAETSQLQAQPTDSWRAIDRAFPETSSGPGKSLVPHGFVEKKKKEADFVDSRKILLRGYKCKDTKHDRKKNCSNWGWGDRRSIDRGRRESPLQVDRVFFSTSSFNNFRFAFLALKLASQAFTWTISICSAKINHVLRCALSRELATGRARLRTAVRGAALQLQLTEPKEQRVTQRGLGAQAGKSELKSSPGPAILLDMMIKRERRRETTTSPQKKTAPGIVTCH